MCRFSDSMLQKNVRFLLSRPLKRFTSSLSNIYADRTHTCGELRSSHIGRLLCWWNFFNLVLGEKVSLSGWLEFRRMNKFLVVFEFLIKTLAFRCWEMHTVKFKPIFPRIKTNSEKWSKNWRMSRCFVWVVKFGFSFIANWLSFRYGSL